MKPVRTFTMRGKRIAFKRVPPSKCVVRGKQARGYFWDDLVAVSSDLEGEELLEVIIHEALHAAFPDLSDDADGPVETTAADLARLLWRLGYRDLSTIVLDDAPS